MYKIEKTPYGYFLAFVGFIEASEAAKWKKESGSLLIGTKKNFGVIVDLTLIKSLPIDSRKIMLEGQQMYKTHGMERSAVLLKNKIITMQFKKLAKESGIYEWERYISSENTKDAEKLAMDWVVNSIDPDRNQDKI